MPVITTLKKAAEKKLRDNLHMNEENQFDLQRIEVVVTADPKLLTTAPLVSYVTYSQQPNDEQARWIHWLLERGANPNLIAFRGDPPPAEVLAQWTEMELVASLVPALLARGADPADFPPQLRDRFGISAPPASAAAPQVSAPAKTVATPATYDKAQLDELLVRLKPFANESGDALRERLASLNATGLGPWGYLNAALDKLRPALRVEEARSTMGPFLGWMIAGSEACFADPDRDELTSSEIKDYPKAAQAGLKQKLFVGQHGADVYYLVKKKDGAVQVCHAHPEGHWILGETVPEFVANELAKAKL